MSICHCERNPDFIGASEAIPLHLSTVADKASLIRLDAPAVGMGIGSLPYGRSQ